MSIIAQSTICALATPVGIGAIAVIRVSGAETFPIVQKLFRGKKLADQASHTIVFGTLRDEDGGIVDEVLLSLFRTPHSYTREDTIEISCHGSAYIIQKILRLLIQNGCQMAQPGEFTQRAFLNGQLDLAQAEAVADLIASDNDASHRAAIHQIRGGFSKDIAQLREQLIHFASLIELELDFGEEDVEFADRDQLRRLINAIRRTLQPLIDSFMLGNALKEGIPVAIVGPPNAGKSTLLNALLNEEKAIVTEIAGTTRDVIEDTLIISGIKFRILDTAGIRTTNDRVEAIGVERSLEALNRAEIILKLSSPDVASTEFEELFAERVGDPSRVISIHTKADLSEESNADLAISAQTGQGIEELKQRLLDRVNQHRTNDTVVTNLRHFEHLTATDASLQRALNGLDAGITQDWLAMDIRQALLHLGEITGQITTDDLLENIFSKFCIGK
ncbi:tRNA uridine-5-carboxymethylaminomethyl(34) synthesis GTPase MnmE [Siphonobacter sp. SORGH_AS_0500]|uniref:tRNA uridine-5-carboxymethylaminomethyl(34) synthesis GTPase MnmE n=1 Tax=Siphonobacter sp. SORGH_AS_0500 TaxID=1864824 RepID=UPI00285AD1DB|nr:tRNA uridine-5-carboxymethylaminomethyl(34) synthesis GTPase MnmE [Siphonobacter sp. SORGH_AS_0500]MDR6195332.1 tRNA modification GTPase [Siphonobacter sp. SORGH_AS_0500]